MTGNGDEHDETRRRLSDRELESIKNQLLESIYADIGKSVIKKILWIVGALAAASFAWLAGKGYISVGK